MKQQQQQNVREDVSNPRVSLKLAGSYFHSDYTSWHIASAINSFTCIANQHITYFWRDTYSLQWRHNGNDSVSNHQPHDCLLNRLFRRRSKKTSKLRVTGLYARNSPGTGEFPHKWPVSRKMCPFDDVIMCCSYIHGLVHECSYSSALAVLH